MSDFKQLVHERKVTARSAKNHVNGKRGKCKLPHEYLSKKELNALNGEVITVNPNKRITWDEFRGLPPHLMEHYYNTVVATYNVGISNMAKMWGVSDETLRMTLKAYGVHTEPQKKGRKKIREGWETFLGEPKEEPKEEQKREGLVRCYSMTLKAMTWEEVIEVVRGMPIPDHSLITVSVHE